MYLLSTLASLSSIYAIALFFIRNDYQCLFIGVCIGLVSIISFAHTRLFSRNNKSLPTHTTLLEPPTESIPAFPNIPELPNVTLPPLPPIPPVPTETQIETEVETQVGSKFETLDL